MVVMKAVAKTDWRDPASALGVWWDGMTLGAMIGQLRVEHRHGKKQSRVGDTSYVHEDYVNIQADKETSFDRGYVVSQATIDDNAGRLCGDRVQICGLPRA